MKPRRERHTGSLYLRGSTWWAKYYVRGAAVRVSTGTADPGKAKKFLRTRTGEVAAGVHQDVTSLRYEDLRATFYLDYEGKKRKSLRHDEEGNPYIDKVRRLDSFFRNCKAQEIDAELVRQFQKQELDRGMSAASVNRSVSALRRMFSLAKQDKRLRDLPYFPMLKEAKPRKGFVEKPQYERLMRVVPDYLRVPLAIGFHCGMRRGEVLALRWEAVDFVGEVIRLNPGETKNDEGRYAPITPELRELLLAARAKRDGCAFVCYRHDKRGHVVRVRTFRKAWATATKKAGLPGLLYHDLRRSGVRNLVRAGVSTKVAREISGHKTEAVFSRYNISNEQDIRDAGRKLADYLARHAAEENGHNTGTELHQDAAVRSRIN